MNLLSFQDEQPDVQGLAVLLSSERYATNSPIGMLFFSVFVGFYLNDLSSALSSLSFLILYAISQ